MTGVEKNGSSLSLKYVMISQMSNTDTNFLTVEFILHRG